MATKTTKNKQKPKETVKKVKVDPEEMARQERQSTVDDVYELALSGLMLNNQDRVATARALEVLRSIEMRKEPAVEQTIQVSYQKCKVKILKLLIEEVLEKNLRFIDVPIILEMIANDSHMLSVWEYENLDEADRILNGVVPQTRSGMSSMELFNSLGLTMKEMEGDDDDSESE